MPASWTDTEPVVTGPFVSGTRSPLRVVDGGMGARQDPVARLHRFQGDHPDVQFTSPNMGGHGRYIALIPAATIVGESREITVNSLDLTGLMDQLDDLFAPPPDTG